MSSCTTTVPNSVLNSEPVGQTSKHAAVVQCLHTSELISQRKSVSGSGTVCSTNATWRQTSAPRPPVLSYESPVSSNGVGGMAFHSLHATSHALQPMQTVVS